MCPFQVFFILSFFSTDSQLRPQVNSKSSNNQSSTFTNLLTAGGSQASPQLPTAQNFSSNLLTHSNSFQNSLPDYYDDNNYSLDDTSIIGSASELNNRVGNVIKSEQIGPNNLISREQFIRESMRKKKILQREQTDNIDADDSTWNV